MIVGISKSNDTAEFYSCIVTERLYRMPTLTSAPTTEQETSAKYYFFQSKCRSSMLSLVFSRPMKMMSWSVEVMLGAASISISTNRCRTTDLSIRGGKAKSPGQFKSSKLESLHSFPYYRASALLSACSVQSLCYARAVFVSSASQ